MARQELRVVIFSRTGRPLTGTQIAEAITAAATQAGVRVTGTAKVIRITREGR